MSHSTHVGFNSPPPGTAATSSWPACLLGFLPLPLLWQRASGVGSSLGVWLLPNFTASIRLTPACALLPCRFLEPLAFASPAVGVGHSVTAP